MGTQTRKEEPWRDIAVTFRYEKDRLARWMKQSAVGRRRNTIYILILAFLAFNFLVVVPTAERKAGPLVLGLVCLGLAAALALYQKKGNGPGRVDKLYRQGAEYRVFFREQGFTISCEGDSDTVRYDEKVRVREYETHISFYYRDHQLFILPRSALEDRQSAALSHFLGQRLGNDYKFSA